MSEAKDSKGKRTYALPTIFTVGTLFCGYYCLMKTVQAISLPPDQLDQAAHLYNQAALAIGLAVFTDGMDGRIARLTNAVSDFGREIGRRDYLRRGPGHAGGRLGDSSS
jgi:CDP-diacylglycerol--serine O-phosphatidyltransferase